MANIPVLYLNYKYFPPEAITVDGSLPITIGLSGTALARPTLVGSIGISPTLRGSIMRGQAGDVEGRIAVPISFRGTIDYIPPILLSVPVPITISIRAEIVNPFYIYCWGGDVVLPVFTVSGDGIVSESGVSDFNLPLITLEASGTVDAFGNASFELPIISVSATGEDEVIGTASFSLPKITISASTLISSSGDASFEFPVISLSAEGVVGAVGTLDKSFPMLKLSAGSLNEILGDGDIVLPMFTLITSALPTTAYLSMVMNLKNRALTLYDNYDFNSMCRFKDKHFGATKTGIYDLDTGTTDNGTLIDWNFRTGYLDLEQKNKKKLKQAWLSYKTDGDLILTVIQPNGDEYEYSLQGIDSTETGHRVKFGKGIRSKYVALDIRNVDGSTITLDTLKLHFDKLSLNR